MPDQTKSIWMLRPSLEFQIRWCQYNVLGWITSTLKYYLPQVWVRGCAGNHVHCVQVKSLRIHTKVKVVQEERLTL